MDLVIIAACIAMSGGVLVHFFHRAFRRERNCWNELHVVQQGVRVLWMTVLVSVLTPIWSGLRLQNAREQIAEEKGLPVASVMISESDNKPGLTSTLRQPDGTVLTVSLEAPHQAVITDWQVR